MTNFSDPKFCSECKTKLKRQVIGLNVFYYCQICGRMSSEACLSGGVDVLQVQKSLSAHRISSATGLKNHEDAQKIMVET